MDYQERGSDGFHHEPASKILAYNEVERCAPQWIIEVLEALSREHCADESALEPQPRCCCRNSGLARSVVVLAYQGSVKAFGNWFAKRCREARLEAGLSAHGLRKCGARRCAEAGATEHQLMALFGWSSTKQAALYTHNASRRRLEAAAAPLLMQGQKGNEGVHLPKTVASSWTLAGKKPL